MSDRETLEAALDEWGITFAGNEDQMVMSTKTRRVLRAAARRNLNLLPETCGTCGGMGGIDCNDPECLMHPWHECEVCHGRGTVYPAALVEKGGFEIALIGHEEIESTLDWETETEEFRQFYRDQAVAVLDAVNGYAADKPGREG